MELPSGFGTGLGIGVQLPVSELELELNCKNGIDPSSVRPPPVIVVSSRLFILLPTVTILL